MAVTTNLPAGGQSGSTRRGTALFPATSWRAISLARHTNVADATEGLRQLAVNYWRPLYLYLRKAGESHADAEDSVQGFFEAALGSGFFSHVEREGGLFRSYLLSSLERWRSRRAVREGAQKRGGRVEHVPLDGMAELEVAADANPETDPRRAYDRLWASEMVTRTMDKLRADHVRRRREGWFEALSAVLPGRGELRPYAELAVELGSTEGAVKVAVFQLRKDFVAQLKAEIRSTVLTNEDAEEELRHLVAVIRGD